MKKLFIKLLLIGSLFFSFSFVFASNIEWRDAREWNSITNTTLDRLNQKQINIIDWEWWDQFFTVWNDLWEKWIKWLLFRIARDLRIFIYPIIILIWIIMVIKLIFWSNTEEEVKKLKLWIIWMSIWIILMQISINVYSVMFSKNINRDLATDFGDKLIQPFINLLMLWASFVFISIAIYSFYKIVTANWNDEDIKKWKVAIFQALIWFVVIKFADILVKNTYNPNCWWWIFESVWWTKVCSNIEENTKVIFAIINWLNTFVAIIVILMTIYAWFLIMTSSWEEEKQKKAKSIMLYVALWLRLLFANYLILTFFLKPESVI